MTNRSGGRGGPARARGATTSGKGPGKKKGGSAAASRPRPWGWIAAFTAIVVLCAAGVTYAALASGSGGSASSDGSGGGAAIAGVQTYSGLSRQHVTSQVNYQRQPPVGGRHNPIWVPCNGKVYGQPLPNENAVHSLEHGTVWITYRPGLPDDQRRALAGRVRGQRRVMMSPYPGQPAPVMLSAWGRQLRVDSASDDRIGTFVDRYALGPQTPEPNSTCEAGRMQ